MITSASFYGKKDHKKWAEDFMNQLQFFCNKSTKQTIRIKRNHKTTKRKAKDKNLSSTIFKNILL